MVQKEIFVFFDVRTYLLRLALDESLFVCKSTWTLISLSLVPLENLMFGCGPVSPSESQKRWFSQVFTPPKRRPVAFADAWRITFHGRLPRFPRVFWAQLEDSEDFFFGVCNAQKAHGYEKLNFQPRPWWHADMMQISNFLWPWNRWKRFELFFCITKWHLVQVQKSKKCRKVQPQIKVHAHDRQKRDVQNLHIS